MIDDLTKPVRHGRVWGEGGNGVSDDVQGGLLFGPKQAPMS